MQISKINYRNLLNLKPRLNDPRHQFAMVSTILFITFCITLWLMIAAKQQQQQDQLEHYGKNLSQLSSYQIGLFINDKNLIGLQAILSNLTEQERIMSAVIYNVDNTIIVQAGDIKNERGVDNQTLTTPITLDNSVLGSLTLALNTEVKIHASLIFLLVIIALAMFACGFFFINKRTLSMPAAATQAPLSGKQEDKEGEKVLVPVPSRYSLLILHLNTLDKLYQQLSADARQQKLNQFEAVVSKVLTLYSVQYIGMTNGSIILSFENTDQTSRVFSALCSAYLLQRNSQNHQNLLQFSSVVFDSECDIDPLALLPTLRENLRGAENHLLVQRELIENSDLAERLDYEESSTNSDCPLIRITGFSSSY